MTPVDFSKLSPMMQFKLLDLLYDKINAEYFYMQQDLDNWEYLSSKSSPTRKEMETWFNALKDLREVVSKNFSECRNK
jgi:hypothetical protein